ASSSEKVTITVYDEIIADIYQLLHGGYKEIKQDLKEKMNIDSEQLNFERGKELRDKIARIEDVMERQKVTLNEKTDIDILGYSYNKGCMCVQVFFIRQGKLLERDVSIFPFYTSADDAFVSFIGQFYLHKRYLKPKQVLVPVGTDDELLQKLLEVDVHTPLRGKKKDL